MIEKKRLEELIEQDATIYRTYADVSVQEVKLNKNYMKVDNAFLWQKMTGVFKGCGTPLEQLFETLEEAEWHKEFGCVERTERLNLPTWEEFEEKKFVWFFNSYHKCCCLHYLNCNNKIFINNGDEVIEIGDFTKENYTIACRKAKELFLDKQEVNN